MKKLIITTALSTSTAFAAPQQNACEVADVTNLTTGAIVAEAIDAKVAAAFIEPTL